MSMDIENTLERIKKEFADTKAYNNPEEIEQAKKLIKKTVPFTMRANFSAYLLIDLLGNQQQKRPERAQKRIRRAEPDNAKTFYINVGKFSKTTGKELAQFIITEAALQPEDLVSLIFKQNYSFFSIINEKEAGVIDALNGKTYQGRKLKVNYGKSKTRDN